MNAYIVTAFLFCFCARSIESFSTPSPRGTNDSTARRSSRPRSRPRTSSSDATSTAGPKGERVRGRQRRRRPVVDKPSHAFDAKTLTEAQNANADAIPFDLSSCTTIRRRVEAEPIVIQGGSLAVLTAPSPPTLDESKTSSIPITHNHFRLLSLSELFPKVPDFSNVFWTNSKFREAIRGSMRRDIFHSTPAYAKLSPKVASIMLDDDSSLQGSWRCLEDKGDEETEEIERMVELTQVLQDALGENAPTGDEFSMTLGSLCGTNPSYHWMDIIGVKDREISHSWHQDTGCSYETTTTSLETESDGAKNLENSRYTVMLGFPISDEYTGTGVYSHVIPLKYELLAPDGHSPNEPVLFQGTAENQHIVRPEFGYGKEVLVYRDVDVLHSAPDVAYRSSIMRFM